MPTTQTVSKQASKQVVSKNKPIPSPPPTPLASIRDKTARRSLASACAEIRDYQSQIAVLTALKNDLVATIVQPTLDRLKLVKVEGEGWLAIKVAGGKRLSKTRLVELGVPMRTIEKAMVEGQPSYRVLAKKNGGENEDDEDGG